MYAFAYRNTERGIRRRFAAQWAEERRKLLAAQREAWEAQMRADEEARAREEEAKALRLQMQAQLRANGVPVSRTYHEIERRALKVFSISKAQLRSERRTQDIVACRQFIAYWCRRLTTLSMPAIGRLMGGNDHTTILHSIRKYPIRRAKMGRFLRPIR